MPGAIVDRPVPGAGRCRIHPGGLLARSRGPQHRPGDGGDAPVDVASDSARPRSEGRWEPSAPARPPTPRRPRAPPRELLDSLEAITGYAAAPGFASLDRANPTGPDVPLHHRHAWKLLDGLRGRWPRYRRRSPLDIGQALFDPRYGPQPQPSPGSAPWARATHAPGDNSNRYGDPRLGLAARARAGPSPHRSERPRRRPGRCPGHPEICPGFGEDDEEVRRVLVAWSAIAAGTWASPRQRGGKAGLTELRGVSSHRFGISRWSGARSGIRHSSHARCDGDGAMG